MTVTMRTQAEVDAAAIRTTLESELATLQADCDALDLKSVRPLRAIAAGTATDDDESKVAELEATIATKRARIAEINKALNG